MEFADLFSLEVENQGLTECIALVATISHGKTNQHGKIEYGSSLRHRDVEVCSIGALALYLFSHFHFENEEFPNFEKRENWYKTVVFKGDSPFKAIQYKAQHSTYVDVFKKVGIHTSKVTHANRKSALNMIARENVSGDQQRMLICGGNEKSCRFQWPTTFKLLFAKSRHQTIIDISRIGIQGY
ncbi:hypothetical protein G6F43_012099 [Rhizopus delemar]|nr:hypothetical protein G6F43_012099 [Rhizopus delemar]